MGDEEKLPLEHGIVSARMCGAMSVDTSFECLYRMYAPVVIGWLAIRVEPHAVDDLLQDGFFGSATGIRAKAASTASSDGCTYRFEMLMSLHPAIRARVHASQPLSAKRVRKVCRNE
jgi:hypothetical protein